MLIQCPSAKRDIEGKYTPAECDVDGVNGTVSNTCFVPQPRTMNLEDQYTPTERDVGNVNEAMPETCITDSCNDE